MSAVSQMEFRGEPMVATKNREIADQRLLKFVLESLFAGDRLKPVRDRLMREAWPLPSSFEILAGLVEVYLKQEIEAEAEPAAAALFHSAMAVFRQHQWQTYRSSTAYDVADKKNPDAVYWPNPVAPPPYGRELHGMMPIAKRLPAITRTTPIGSAGSCFALEIMKYLRERSFNYVITEPNSYSCANWGPQYNTVAFRQAVEWTFGLRERPMLVWEEPAASGDVEYHDPFREGVSYKNLDGIGPAIASHRILARRALELVEYFILTVGLNEVWRLGSSDTILARFPRNMAPYLVRNEVLTVEQNVEALQGTLDVLRSFNPRFQMIVTVSPIPLYATFQGHEKHVVVATQDAKAILRVAVERFAAANPNHVSYFPAMETVIWCTKNPWDPDGRHVSREAVGNVMRLFEEMFLTN